MKKKILFLLFLVIFSFGFVNTTKAANATMKVTSSNTNLVIGNTFIVTVTISASQPMANWEFNLNYDTSKLTLVKSDEGLHVLGLDMTQNKKTATYKYTFKAKASGKTTISLGASSILGWDKNEMNLTKTSSTVTIVTQQQVEESYSKNDYLSSLSIEGYELTPKFDKNTLEYSITLPPLTKEIIVNATKEDSKSSINEIGKISVSEGNNQIKIIVTAQKGNTRTYIINALVEELEPINVTVDGKKLSVVQSKESLIEPSNYYTAGTTLINNKVVPSFYSEISKLTLVCLKDETGTIALYIYENGNFKPYKELNFNSSVIYILDNEMNVKGYEKTNIKIGDSLYNGYKKDNGFPLIYGMNIATGEEGLYSYDEKENTIQRFVENDNSFETNLYFYGVIGLSSILIITYIVIIIALINKGKRKRQRLEQTIKLQNTMKIPDIKKEEVKISDEERSNLLGKTRYDIGAITSYNDEKILTKKELKQEKKLAKKETKQNKKNKINKDDMAEF